MLAVSLISAIGGGANASSTNYATGVVVGEIGVNASSTNYASCVGFECSVGGVINTSEIILNSGWNLIALDMRQGDNSSDRNISLVAGWNLIGYSAIANNFTLSDASFTNSSNTYSWNNAVANNAVQAYLSYLDTNAQANLSKYKYTSSLSGFDDTLLRTNKGYWIYANSSGNLTLPGVGGSYENATYAWDRLYFRNGSGVVKGASDAQSAGWAGTVVVRRIVSGPGGDAYAWRYVPTHVSSFNSWEGIFIKSNADNITLIRQN